MLIELNQLPTVMQQHILNKNTEIVQVVNNGQVISDVQFNQPKSYAKGDCDYDLERMKKAVNAPCVVVPKFDTPEKLLEWMDNLTDSDFMEKA